MTSAAEVRLQLPALRRFARALAGSQTQGDALVSRCLQTIIETPHVLTQGEDARASLFGCFVQLVGAGALDQENNAASDLLHVRTLQAMSQPVRLAFLLSALEGFRREQIAKMLRCSQPTVDELIAAAGAEIADRIATLVLIIEDEPLIALDLETELRELGHEISGVASTHREAVLLARKTGPGLILADIQLADDSSGLEAVNEVLAEFSIPVIFVTAFPQRLLTGDKPEPAFLLSKPFDRNALRAMVSQVLFFEEVARPAPSAPPDPLSRV
ncbi:response regulator [Amorphus sp. 3PC139-8]|uniref:response regulator n=1 Tax=Amorphus sp. 3PC139-8 TaxID=2735676 RepID=UPI00345D90E5